MTLFGDRACKGTALIGEIRAQRKGRVKTVERRQPRTSVTPRTVRKKYLLFQHQSVAFVTVAELSKAVCFTSSSLKVT